MTFADLSAISVEDGLAEDFEFINARLCVFLEKIVVLDFKESYLVDGARSMAEWLSMRFGFSAETSRQYVKAAKALDYMPATKDAFLEGHLCWDQVRWLTEFCTFEEDVEWSQKAIGMSVAEIRSVALSRARLTRELADARFRRRYVRAKRDVDAGYTNIWIRLPDVEGEIVLKGIDRKATVAAANIPFEQRRADALVELCSMALGADKDRDRATVVVHTDLDAFIAADRNGMLEGGTFIAPETLRRLTCDSRIQTAIHTSDRIIYGRTSRVIPAHLRRELRLRDRRCTFAGCTNDVWLDAHHIDHWGNGGETVLENLALLCGYHHRLMHEGGWSMFRTDEGDWVFMRPDGRPLFTHATKGAGAKTLALARAP